jgi:basic amino acid/polyamine antiporter, APA family
MTPTTNSSTAQLKRSIGLVSAIALVISNIVGTGVFKKVVPMAAELQSPTLILLAWLLAGLLSLSGTLSNAEVASMLADSGGEYVYFRKIYGRFCSAGPALP